jgi:hypothetical protein
MDELLLAQLGTYRALSRMAKSNKGLESGFAIVIDENTNRQKYRRMLRPLNWRSGPIPDVAPSNQVKSV